ncbi:conserved hypothetical protein [Candidatus Methylobacter favarea]|uniref:Uncharacterized protein n=1 Tax=Candidatus Methylobacter favarea TaxID=2707345 RepID=A0A8S0YAH8_9GAMM|nr:hypothetical protein [Candidatus Methylobacter favarea]CAA9891917.1 conserved hypothetical protein [Candidatus Methylobacter favarea]
MKLKDRAAKIGQFIRSNPLNALLACWFIIVLVILSRLYFSANVDDSNWEQFKIEHHCKLRMTKTGTQRSSWECDDRKIYYRWRQQR